MNRVSIAEWLREGIRVVDLHRRSSLLDSGRRNLKADSGTPPVVVTLSTLPGRIGKILPALNSLLDQTMLPDRIILNIPAFSTREKRCYDVPESLSNHSVVTILHTNKDWGPATKLLPVLRYFAAEPDTLILALDDDNIYPTSFIETFQYYAVRMPFAALSLRGWHIPNSRRWLDVREFKGTEIDVPVPTDVIQGCGGILVRPRFFTEDIFDYSGAPPESFFVDDLWISGNLARRQVPRFVIPYSGAFVYCPSFATFLGPGLDRTDNLTGKNNDVMMDYFREYWQTDYRIDSHEPNS